MVSLYQVQTLQALNAEGWYDVRAPFDLDQTPIGGPTVMMNTRGDVIRVFADGSIAMLTETKVVSGDTQSIAARRVGGEHI